MFGKIGQFASLMSNLPKIGAETEALKARIAELSAEGDAGAGMVKVKVNGKMEIVKYNITDEALADREMLEDLLTAATNQAMARIRQQIAEETQKMAANLGMPPGMSLPGMPGTE